MDLEQCIINCDNQQACENTCVDHFKVEYETCPCQVGLFRVTDQAMLSHSRENENFKLDCPYGCPCNAFDCEPDKKSILVLSTYQSFFEPVRNKPVLIQFDGE